MRGSVLDIWHTYLYYIVPNILHSKTTYASDSNPESVNPWRDGKALQHYNTTHTTEGIATSQYLVGWSPRKTNRAFE